MIRKHFFETISAFVVTGALCLTAFVPSAYSQATVTIDVSGATHVVPNGMYGALMERLGRQWSNQGSIFVGTTSTTPHTNGMRNDVIAGLKECGLGAAQWPGGCAAWSYRWSPPNPSGEVGTDRFLEFCQLVGCEPIICGPHYSTSRASNLAWIKHIDSVTAQRGMDSLRWFKIGNEVWGGCGDGMDASTYCTNYKPNATALRAYRPSLKLEACGPNEERGADSISRWFNRLYSDLDTTMDGIEYHDYIFRTTWNSINFTAAQYWQIMADGTVCDFGYHMKTNIIPGLNAADPTKRVKLIVDEWGDWLAGDNWLQTGSLMNGLSAGNQLHLLMSHSDRIAIACIAQGVNVIHSLMNINTSGQLIKTPTFYVFKMFKPHHTHGAKWAPVTATNVPTTTQNVGLTTWATATPTAIPLLTVGSTVDTNGRVNISATNVDLTASRSITVTLTSSELGYEIDSAQIVSGSAMNSNNPFGGAEAVNIQNFGAANYALSNNGKTVTATLPPRSIVMLRLKKRSGLYVQNRNQLSNLTGAFSIKAGARGTVLVTATVSRKMLVRISLYSADGRTLIDRVSRTFEPGSSACVIGNRVTGNGIYIVRITGEDIDISRQVILAK